MSSLYSGEEENFERYAIGTMVDHLDQPYDYDSIMHYKETSFAKDMDKPTITPKLQGAKIGQRDHLSTIDIRMIQLLYGCVTNSKLL